MLYTSNYKYITNKPDTLWETLFFSWWRNSFCFFKIMIFNVHLTVWVTAKGFSIPHSGAVPQRTALWHKSNSKTVREYWATVKPASPDNVLSLIAAETGINRAAPQYPSTTLTVLITQGSWNTSPFPCFIISANMIQIWWPDSLSGLTAPCSALCY